MQKLAPLMAGVMTAWLCAAHAQAPDYIIQSNAAPLNPVRELIAPLAKPRPVSPPRVAASSPAVAMAAAAASPLVAAPVASHPARGKKIRIGLLLPSESKTLGEAAQVVRAGFDAAAATDGNADLVYIDEQAPDVLARYREAVSSGVKVMVGPLTRQGIARIASHVTVPTLALNALEPGVAVNRKLLSLSLTVEGEAHQMAHVMHDDGRVNPLVIGAGDVLSRRLVQAFSEQWKKETGSVARVLDWPVSSSLADALSQSDAVFVAMAAPDAAALKAALPSGMTVYATSQLNSRKPEAALAGIRFIDMPWFLMTEQAEVRHYPRPSSVMTVQTERLYALGIDAYRLAVQMGSGKWTPSSLKLYGVTGDLRLGRDRQFERILPLAVMMSESRP